METAAAGQMVGSEVDSDGGGAQPTAAPRHRSTPPGDYFDGSLEPMMRCRANTWPCRPDNSSSVDENRSTPTSVDGVQSDGRGDPTLSGATTVAAPGAALHAGATRKAAARRNAWGNLSYADLITRAIESSPENRLTLSQIYGWMVENVPFFKDKGDSNSSAGWKNSIRHNLSLHSRFMRVQNESTGKSSWWVINPDVKHLRTPRRRAATMDNTKMPLQLRRARLKGSGLTRVVSAERPLMAFAYDGSSDRLEAAACEHISPDVLGLASQNYRIRSSSNASSLGRLSPIPASAEPDASDSRYGIMPLPLPALSWKNICLPSENCTETLSESLASIFVEDMKKPMLIGGASCRGNIMIPNSNALASCGGIMVSNVTTVHNQNGGNIVVAHSGCDQVGHSRNHIGLNGSMRGLHSYSQSAAGRESSGGVSSHHVWPVYHHQQSNGVFPSSSNSVAGDGHDKRHLYDMETEFSMPPSFSPSDVLYYGDGQGRLSGNLCRSASETGFSQYGVSSVNGPAPQYSNSAVSRLIKQEPESSSSCFYAGSGRDHKADMSGTGIMMGMVAPMTSAVKVEKPSGPFPSESPGGISNWQDQQQQQQSPRQPGAGHSLGPIDPRKLMKILAEKPHLKEKMLQLIQQKRQQLTQQRHGYATAAAVPRLVDPLRSKQALTNNENRVNHRSPTGGSIHFSESPMPVDLDLDFDTTLAINCDIDQVLQHEMNFGELDFGVDHLQVKLSGSDMDYNSFGF